jgi:pre-mRNA-splicing factor ATP-dependent RNA helicase DHX16
MAGIVVWVADRLHEIVGLSDRQVAEYLTELARRSNNFEELKRKLESSGAIEMTSAVESFVFELWAKFPREKATRERVAKDVKKVPYKLLLEEEPEFGADSVGKDTKRSQNIRPQKGMVWESDDEDIQPPSGDESGSDSDEWERVEQERKKDLAERDAFSARIRLKDKDKTSHFVEKSDKKAFEEVKKRHQLEVKDKKKLVHELRKESRRDYLGKRRVEKVVELKDDVADEEFVFSDSKLTRVEKDHYEHKRKILTLTSEREKAAELEHIQRYFMPTENVMLQKYLEPKEDLEVGPNADVKKWQEEQIDKATVTFIAKDAKEKYKQKEYDLVMDEEEIQFVLIDSVSGNTEDVDVVSDVERRRMDIAE